MFDSSKTNQDLFVLISLFATLMGFKLKANDFIQVPKVICKKIVWQRKCP